MKPLNSDNMSYLGEWQGWWQKVADSTMELQDSVSSLPITTVLCLVAASLAFFVAAKLIPSLFCNNGPKSLNMIKAQHARTMRKEFNSIENGSVSSQLYNKKDGEAAMEVSQLWVYPIKALRGCQVPTATLTKEGFAYDRKFVLLKILKESPREVQHISISTNTSVCLFHTSIERQTLTVTYRPPGVTEAEAKRLEIPLEPLHFKKLERVDINMHHSPSSAFNMDGKYNEWFSEIFGFKVILAYWGRNPRQVLGNLPGKPSDVSSKQPNLLSSIISRVPVIGSILKTADGVIAFNDCAPYLVITEESAADVTTRLPEGVEVDITKFRANIILKGSLSAFDEDFWGGLVIGDSRVLLTGNCGRCSSLNIDYETGKSGTGRDGTVLKLLSKDRRVDKGFKYSPIFGRYGFVSRKSEGGILGVGDAVFVNMRNTERTKFYWPGLST